MKSISIYIYVYFEVLLNGGKWRLMYQFTQLFKIYNLKAYLIVIVIINIYLEGLFNCSKELLLYIYIYLGYFCYTLTIAVHVL